MEISLALALTQMELGEAFSCTFVTLNRINPKQDGRIIELVHAKKIGENTQAETIRVKLPNGNFREFHPRLMTKFNNNDVIW